MNVKVCMCHFGGGYDFFNALISWGPDFTLFNAAFLIWRMNFIIF